MVCDKQVLIISLLTYYAVTNCKISMFSIVRDTLNVGFRGMKKPF